MSVEISESLKSLPTPENYWFGIGISATTTDYNHCGIVYFDFEDKCQKILHLAFHHDLRHHQLTPGMINDYKWVRMEAHFHEDDARDFANQCKWIFEANEGNVPYGVKFDRTIIDEATNLIKFNGEGVGVTCSTFVMLVFKRFGIDLINSQTWEEREDDKIWHEYIVSILKQCSIEENHIKIFEAESPCARIRPEEIAASCMFENKPVNFKDIIPISLQVHNEVRG